MEEWHPMLIIVLVALFGIFLYAYLWILFALQLPPIIFVPLLFIAPILLYLYRDAVRKYYKERNVKKLSALVVGFTLVFAVPISVYEIIKPNWYFELRTDKTLYKVGENVTVTITLTNNAYLTQTLKERSFPLTVEYEARNGTDQVAQGRSTFCEGGIPVAPGDSLQRSYTWFSLGRLGNYSVSCWVGTPYRSVSFEGRINVTVTS